MINHTNIEKFIDECEEDYHFAFLSPNKMWLIVMKVQYESNCFQVCHKVFPDEDTYTLYNGPNNSAWFRDHFKVFNLSVLSHGPSFEYIKHDIPEWFI